MFVNCVLVSSFLSLNPYNYFFHQLLFLFNRWNSRQWFFEEAYEVDIQINAIRL